MPDSATHPAPYVFISYASADRELVLSIVDALQREGISCWVDQHGIEGGANWGQRIAEAIEGCVAFILMSSRASLTSRNVRQEITLGWKYSKPYLPVLLDMTPVPKEIEYWLETAQWIEILDQPEGIWLPKVIAALDRLGCVIPRPSNDVINADEPLGGPPHRPTVVIPAPLTNIIGRQTEIEEIAQLLLTARLVTLTGSGGTGKTRLAIAVAQAVQDDFPDGVVFVDLSPIRDPSLVVPTIASILEIQESAGQPIREALEAFLRERHLLLVMDNLEQVVDAAPDLAVLLAACANLHMLTTSRVPLHLRGEHEYVVEPLPIPPETHGRSIDLSHLVGNDAVKLFVERAAAVKRSFSLTPDNAAAIVAICRRLDGLPLAIELAAARAKLMTPDAILTRLERPLLVLTGGPRDLPPRQQTIHDTIQWSYDLLPSQEQALFARLAVFHGGWTLEGAEGVVNPIGHLSIDVLEGLASLVENSLVVQREQADGEPRFTMLETIREFAVERLLASGMEVVIHRAHSAYYTGFAERAIRAYHDPHGHRWLDRLEEELGNIRAVLAWSLDHADPETALRLAGELRQFWPNRSHSAEARGWLEVALERGVNCPPAIRTRAELALAVVLHELGDDDRARPLFQQAVDFFREHGHHSERSIGVYFLAMIAADHGDFEVARAMFTESLVLDQQLGDRWGQLLSLGNLGWVARLAGNLSEAEQHLDQVLELAQSQGHTGVEANAWEDLAFVALQQGRYALARERFRRCLVLTREVGDVVTDAHAIEGLAAVAIREAHPEQAAMFLGVAEALRTHAGSRIVPVDRAEHEATVAMVQRALGVERFTAVWEAGRAIAIEEATSLVLQLTDS